MILLWGLPGDTPRVALAAKLEMSVVGIDLRCTPDGQWYCFEVNPSPAFTYFQDATGDAIDEAIARLLIAGVPYPQLPTQYHHAVSC